MGNIHMVLDAKDIEEILQKLTQEIVAAHKRMDSLALIGVHTRGVFLANRIRSLIKESQGIELETGAVDINLYRDDWTRIGAQPVVRKSEIEFNIDEKQIVLIDDVLFTGRTVRAAMDALIDYGRPRKIELAILADRGVENRELPIMANYVGGVWDTKPEETINVYLEEEGFEDYVAIERKEAP